MPQFEDFGFGGYEYKNVPIEVWQDYCDNYVRRFPQWESLSLSVVEKDLLELPETHIDMFGQALSETKIKFLDISGNYRCIFFSDARGMRLFSNLATAKHLTSLKIERHGHSDHLGEGPGFLAPRIISAGVRLLNLEELLLGYLFIHDFKEGDWDHFCDTIAQKKIKILSMELKGIRGKRMADHWIQLFSALEKAGTKDFKLKIDSIKPGELSVISAALENCHELTSFDMYINRRNFLNPLTKDNFVRSNEFDNIIARNCLRSARQGIRPKL